MPSQADHKQQQHVKDNGRNSLVQFNIKKM